MAEAAAGASATLLKLHEPKYVAQWNADIMMASFWEISCNVIMSTALHLLDGKTMNPTAMLCWLEKVLANRNKFLRQHKVLVLVLVFFFCMER